MKKLLGVSIAAMLAVTPMIASANGSAPTAATDAAATNEPFVGVALDQTAHIATTSYVQGAYNAAIGAVNTRLKTAASGNANIDQTVKTTIAAAVDDASDTALVTEKAIRTALNSVASNAVITGGAGIKNTDNTLSVDLTQSGTGNDAYNASGLVMTGSGNDATLGINKGNGLEVISTSGADQGKLAVKGGDGIAVDSNGVAVDLVTTNPTLQITSNKLEAKVGDGLQAGSTGIEAKLHTNGGLDIDSTSKGIKVVVDGTTIENNGGTLQVKSGVYDAYGDAAAVETKLTTGGGANGYDINAKSLQVQGSDVSTEDGVTATISNSTVPVYTTWNAGTTANVNVQSSYYTTTPRTNGVNAAPANP